MGIPNWVILAIIAGIGSNVFNFYNRYFLKDKGDSNSWAFFYEFTRLFIFVLILPFDFYFNINTKSILILLALGLTEFIAAYLYMKMHLFSELSISTILSRIRLVWIPIIAFVFLGERLQVNEYLGIIVLFLGLSIAIAPHKLVIDKGAIYANLAAFMIAINIVIMKLAIPYTSTSVMMIAFSLPAVVLFPLFMKNSKVRILKEFKQNLPLKLVPVFANVITLYLFIWALKLGDISKVNAIFQGTMVFGVLAGIIFLKERKDIIRKILGTGVTIIGVILLT